MLSSAEEGSEPDDAVCKRDNNDYTMYAKVWNGLVDVDYQTTVGELSADGTLETSNSKGSSAALLRSCAKIRCHEKDVSTFGEFVLEVRWPVTAAYTRGTKVWLSRTHPERDALAHPFEILEKAGEGSSLLFKYRMRL